jgi:hypothetical protein
MLSNFVASFIPSYLYNLGEEKELYVYLKERVYLGDLGVDGRILLRWIFRK